MVKIKGTWANVCSWWRNVSSVSLQMKLLILLFFKFALFTLYKELSHKSELIFLNESNTKQKLQMTEQWMLIDPESAL